MRRRKMNVRMQYPYNGDFEYIAQLKILNLEKERAKGITEGKDFFITGPQGIKKDIKSDSSIFSTLFGANFTDKNAYEDRYSCKCGKLKGTMNNGHVCQDCNSVCKYVDDDFNRYGWVVLRNGYKVIHPTLFENVKSIIGPQILENIIKFKDEANEDGFATRVVDPNSKSLDKYDGIGMTEFCNKIDEILEFFSTKIKKSKPAKYEEYLHVMKHRDCLLTDSIPVFTTFLRMINITGDKFVFVKSNKWYNNIARCMQTINSNDNYYASRQKTKDSALYDLQTSITEIYNEILTTISKKKGSIRQLMGGRYNFSARSVIIPDPKLRIDEIRLSYSALVVLLEQTIVNILVKTYGISYIEAYKKWFKSQIKKDDIVFSIIENIIQSKPRGIEFIINRNPSINYGSLLQMYCVGINNDSYAMSVPLQILNTLGADFDGDCMNILLLLNKEFIAACEEVFNPANALMISRNDGLFSNDVNHFKDTIVNLNSFLHMGRDAYSEEEIEYIKSIRNSN